MALCLLPWKGGTSGVSGMTKVQRASFLAASALPAARTGIPAVGPQSLAPQPRMLTTPAALPLPSAAPISWRPAIG